jgi:sugar/nucleoside kinase (ribokinase family)
VAALDVSVIGELNLDLVLYGLPQTLVLEREHLAKDLSITLGSSSAIFAHNLALLGNKVGFSSCIGDDPFGEICVRRLSESGVDVSRVRRLKGKTTGLTVILPQRKDRYILTYPGAMYAMTERELDFSYVFNARHLHVSSYYLQKGIRAQLVEIFRKAKDAHLTVSLDTNDDPEDRWSGDIQLLLRYVDILFLNEREACKLAQTEDVEKAVETLSQKVSLLVVKRGSRGATARAGKERLSAFPPVVDMVDPIGAGDTFDAGFIHKFIRGAKTEECLKFANVAGALSVTRPGGTEAFRDATVREAFFRKNAVAPEPSRPVAPRPTKL